MAAPPQYPARDAMGRLRPVAPTEPEQPGDRDAMGRLRPKEAPYRAGVEEEMHPRSPTSAEIKAPQHLERFEVVLMSRKTNLGDATPRDFKRVAVTAVSPHEARHDKTLEPFAGDWLLVGVTKDHVLTEEEKTAQSRAVQAEQRPVDKRKLK